MIAHRPIQSVTWNGEDEITLHTVCVFCDQATEIATKIADFNAFGQGTKSAQEAFPYLTDDEREMLISGTCPRCFPAEPVEDWDARVAEDELLSDAWHAAEEEERT